MVRNTAYLGKFKGIIKALADQFNVSEEYVEDLIDNFFLTLKKFITDPRMPTVKISKWGTFKPTLGKLNWAIGTTLFHMSQDRGDRDKMFKKIRVVQHVKERLLREKAGELTWKEWKNKTIEDLEAEGKKQV